VSLKPHDIIIRENPAAQDQDWYPPCSITGTHPIQDVESIHLGHHEIQDQQVESQARQFGAGIRGVSCGPDDEVVFGKKFPEQFSQAVVIIDNKDMRENFVHLTLRIHAIGAGGRPAAPFAET
jgi:hypothetical protein